MVLGAFSVDVPTLNRFFALHYLFPFLLAGLILLHIFFLHEARSGNPSGSSSNINNDGTPFGFYYIIKDIYGFLFYFFILFYLVFFYPNFLGHSDNYILANPTVTPAHIVPEWYFLPFYAILRSITNKLAGVILMLFAIIIFIFIPKILQTFLKAINFLSYNSENRFEYHNVIGFFISSALILGWIGGNPAVTPYVEIGFYAMISYFVCLTIGIYITTMFDFFLMTNIFYIDYIVTEVFVPRFSELKTEVNQILNLEYEILNDKLNLEDISIYINRYKNRISNGLTGGSGSADHLDYFCDLFPSFEKEFEKYLISIIPPRTLFSFCCAEFIIMYHEGDRSYEITSEFWEIIFYHADELFFLSSDRERD